jgi:probable F420-dependent oxidoreductase
VHAVPAAGASPPRFAVGLPQTLEGDDPRAVAAYAIRAETLGFTGLWTLDSPPGNRTAHWPILDALHTLSHVAAVTSAPRLGVAVVVLPRRNPAILARELATIDRLSGGRLTVGVGLGRVEDADTLTGLGLPADRPVRRLVEGMEVMRVLWAQAEARHDGELYHLAGVPLEPKPLQRPGPPVWLGGGVAAALRRAARLGDGWIGSGSSSADDFAEQAAAVARELAATGRDRARFTIAKRVYIAVEDDADVARRRLAGVLDAMYAWPGLGERVGVTGTAEQCAEQLRRLASAGAEGLVLAPMYGHLAQLERLAEVARLMRAT